MPIRIISGAARLSRSREIPPRAADTSRRLSSTLRRNSTLSVSAATSSRIRWYTGSRPARACARLTPGRRRARTLSHVVLCPVHTHAGVFGCAAIGIQRSTLSPGVSLAKPRRATPTMANAAPLRRTLRPTDGRIATEPSSPERVADHGHGGARRLRVVGDEQGTANGSQHAKRREVVARDPLHIDRLGRTIDRGGVTPCCRCGERVNEVCAVDRDSAIGSVRERFGTIGIECGERDELLRTLGRKRAQHDRVDGAEDGRVGPYPQRQREHDHDRKCRRPAQSSRRVPHIAPRLLDGWFPSQRRGCGPSPPRYCQARRGPLDVRPQVASPSGPLPQRRIPGTTAAPRRAPARRACFGTTGSGRR